MPFVFKRGEKIVVLGATKDYLGFSERQLITFRGIFRSIQTCNNQDPDPTHPWVPERFFALDNSASDRRNRARKPLVPKVSWPLKSFPSKKAKTYGIIHLFFPKPLVFSLYTIKIFFQWRSAASLIQEQFSEYVQLHITKCTFSNKNTLAWTGYKLFSKDATRFTFVFHSCLVTTMSQYWTED